MQCINLLHTRTHTYNMQRAMPTPKVNYAILPPETDLLMLLSLPVSIRLCSVNQ